MDPKKLAMAISHLLEDDQEYCDIMPLVEQYEPAYRRILAGLSSEDREALELYVAACEDAQYHRIYPAYRLGKHSTKMEIVV